MGRSFDNELAFEKALINLLFEKGWEREVLKYQTEDQLIKNWANILYDNNRQIDRLGDYPLTDSEMQQIIDNINAKHSPLLLNEFINGKTTTIKRDNPDDQLHFGKEVTLKIYDRSEIAAGQSRYQIVEQPVLRVSSELASPKRGDFMLLINGMPVIHVELKKSGIPVSQAANQIQRYSHAGVYSRGIFSLVQIFVAMNPEEMIYFANTGDDKPFNSDYFFHWANVDNEPINDWESIADRFLSIPMAHQMLGFYTVADDRDGILKVMRSYQYYAANAISDRVARTKWEESDKYGGFIEHATGSGKTMTSFKSAQLISASNDADKVVFLMDRIELGTQSLEEYQGFANDSETVQSTENTAELISRLASSETSDTLIVTSIQKMSRIIPDSTNRRDIEKINKKRVVIIVDEAHRSTFGEMLASIKNTFKQAIFFGFTATPIYEENSKKMNTTSSVFGNQLHRYSIADGIRDKNILGFDPYMVLTYRDRDLRRAIALEKAHASSEEEAIRDAAKQKVYYKYINEVPMAGFDDEAGNHHDGIEDFIRSSQYDREEHREAVVTDIKDNWTTLSHSGKFHAILATHCIPEAMEYYHLLKRIFPTLKVTCLFDPTIDNDGGSEVKEDTLIEILKDYNEAYDQHFTLPTFAAFKKDVALRLAHKKVYAGIDNKPKEILNLLIVVDQMLTGFDSKWLNTLYLDKELKFEGIIQAFSRTNRLFGPEKPFGTIRYYRKPHTMKKRIEDAFNLYSGNKPWAVFADKLDKNLEAINRLFGEIKEIFDSAKIENYEKLPSEKAEKAKFAKLFKTLNDHLEAAIIQGFVWGETEVAITHNEYLVLAVRYKELFGRPGAGGGGSDDVPYDIDTHLTEINTGAIDTDYMNSRFEKWYKLLHSNCSPEDLQDVKDELHKTFAALTQEEQRFAKLFLGDVERGDAIPQEGKTLRDYITEYKKQSEDTQIHRCAEVFGLNEAKLKEMMQLGLSESSLNEFGRFEALKSSVDREKAKRYFDSKSTAPIPMRRVSMKIDELLRSFILSGGFEL